VVLLGLLLLQRFYRMSPGRVFALLFGLVIAWTLLPAPYKERVLSPKQYTSSKSVQSRMLLQETALRYAWRIPCGTWTGRLRMQLHPREQRHGANHGVYGPSSELAAHVHRTHNMYLQIASDTGFIGLAFIYASSWRPCAGVYKAVSASGRGRHAGRALASTLFISIVGFMLCAVFCMRSIRKSGG